MVGFIQPFVFLSGVIMGTLSTLTVKIIYGLSAIGSTGEMQRFEKPLFTTWIMFLGMTIALPIHYIVEWYKARTNKTNEQAVEVPWRTMLVLIIPSCFDLLGTALSGVGLLFTTVSVYQLIRCSVIIVTAFLKATVLGQKLSNYMWFGIFVNTLAMVLVSSTSFAPDAAANLDVDGNARDPRIGILFILASCVVQGSQYVFEEKVMAVDAAPPLVVVGMEGLWGSILMPLVVFPWSYILPGSDAGGCIENFYDSWVMLQNSPSIQLVLWSFCITILLYNIFCIYVTYLLNSIWHAILDNFRPISVWGTDLVLFYLVTDGQFGEKWTSWSWLEFAGMVMLFVGTAIYNGSFQVPGFDYPPDSIAPVEAIPGTPLHMKIQPGFASPMLTRSPLINKLNHPQTHRDYNIEYGPISLNPPGNNGNYGSVAQNYSQSSRAKK